jgi:hypothetical protein
LLKCISSEKTEYMLKKIHKWIYGLHIGARALVAQTTRWDGSFRVMRVIKSNTYQS